MRRRGDWFLVWLVLAGLAWGWNIWQDRWSGVVVCEVGQGMGVLIKEGRRELVIDGGRWRAGIERCLSRHRAVWDRKVEAVAATHADSDHVGGLVELVSKYEVERFWKSGEGEEGVYEKKLEKEIFENEVEVLKVKRGDRFKLGETEIAVLWPEEKSEKRGANENSIVFLVGKDKWRMLVMGDAPEEVEQVLIWRKILQGAIDVLVVGHHGSKTSTSEELLGEIRPELAVIGVGENSYGHPNSEVLLRLKDWGALVWRTDEKGEWVGRL